MKKVISFSIYGNDRKYTIGLLKNLELSKTIYPYWEIYIYYNDTVPKDMIDKYKEFNNVKLYNMNEFNCPGVLWRFLPDDCDLFISRDADSRLSLREKEAVDEWILSDKKLHIIRDHPHHGVEIHAGLFGLKVEDDFKMKDKILKFINKNNNNDLYNKISDRMFLMEYVYHHYKDNSLSHDSCFTQYINSKPFPSPMKNYHFVGEIFDDNDNRYPQYREWINRKEIR